MLYEVITVVADFSVALEGDVREFSRRDLEFLERELVVYFLAARRLLALGRVAREPQVV